MTKSQLIEALLSVDGDPEVFIRYTDWQAYDGGDPVWVPIPTPEIGYAHPAGGRAMHDALVFQA